MNILTQLLCFALVGLALFLAGREALLVWRGGCTGCAGHCGKTCRTVKKKP